MKTVTLQTTIDELDQAISQIQEKESQIVIFFTSLQLIKDGELMSKLTAALPQAEVIGCSTSGEIGDRVESDTISLMGLNFEKSTFKCATVEIPAAENSHTAGMEFAKKFEGEDLAGLFVLLPGLNVNGSKFTKGVKDVLPRHISVSGGMAGDGLNFSETLTVYNGKSSPTTAVGFAVYGKNVKMSCGSRGGWKPFGPQRHVTKVTDNVLFEIDGNPALDLYKDYLGDKASDLPSSGLLYPFAIMDDNNEDSVGLIRTILDIDENNKSLVLAGDMNIGQLVCLMHANTDELVDGAEEAANIALDNNPINDNDAVICVSCVGRRIVMGDDTEDELDAVKSVFKHGKIAGFYSYGEISMYQDTGEPELHNQTMTVTYITEDVA